MNVKSSPERTQCHHQDEDHALLRTYMFKCATSTLMDITVMETTKERSHGLK